MDLSDVENLIASNEIVTKDNKKYVMVPLESLMKQYAKLFFNKFDAKEPQKQNTLTSEPSIVITNDINKLYVNVNFDAEHNDIVQFLEIVASCWGLHNFPFTNSILKRVSKIGCRLNSAVFKAYGKESDAVLTELVRQNNDYISWCWKKQNDLNIKTNDSKD